MTRELIMKRMGLGFTNMTINPDINNKDVLPADASYTFEDTVITEPMGPPVSLAKKPFPWWILIVAGTAWYLSNKG
jgi:hypothetical protein